MKKMEGRKQDIMGLKKRHKLYKRKDWKERKQAINNIE